MLYAKQDKRPIKSNLQWNNREFKGHILFRRNLVLVMGRKHTGYLRYQLYHADDKLSIK